MARHTKRGSRKGLMKARCVRKKKASGMSLIKARKACGVTGTRRKKRR